MTSASILIVDDHKPNLIALEAVLEPLGQRVVRAHSGREAIALASEQDFVLLLVDAQMPGLDGFDTVERIRDGTRNQNAPVIFVTAVHRDTAFMARGYALGAIDYITKPFDPDFLRAKAAFFVDAFQRKEIVARQEQLLRERERAATEEQAARRVAELANEAKDQFLAMVTHDLRTPTTAIIGWAELLERGLLDADESANALRSIVRCALLQNRLVDDLLDVSRIAAGTFTLDRQSTDLGEVVRAAVAAVGPSAAERGVRLEVTLELVDGAEVLADPTRLQQVLWNLLSNAIKFSHRDSVVELRVASRDEELELVVRDHGVGIAPSFLPCVFERFRQQAAESGRRSGLGLGLAIAKHIVEAHGGRIAAESAGLGEGATLRVVLPRAQRRREPPRVELCAAS